MTGLNFTIRKLKRQSDWIITASTKWHTSPLHAENYRNANSQRNDITNSRFFYHYRNYIICKRKSYATKVHLRQLFQAQSRANIILHRLFNGRGATWQEVLHQSPERTLQNTKINIKLWKQKN